MEDIKIDYVKIEENEIKHIFDSGKYIAEGSYGVVHCDPRNDNYVIKRVSFTESFESILPEIDIGYNFNHPSLCKIVDMIIYDDYIYYVMPKITNNFKHMVINGPFMTNFHMLKLAYKIGQGLKFLHSHNYLHGDLAFSNILIDNNYTQPLICDFGASRISGTRLRSLFCNIAMTPPEFQKDLFEWKKLNSDLHLKFDVWVLGYTIYYITEKGRPPQIELNEDISVYKKRLHDHLNKRHKHTSEMTKFLKATLDPDVNTRSNINDVCELLTSIMRSHNYKNKKLENCGYIRKVFDIASIELPLKWNNELENVYKLYDVSNVQKEFCVKILKKLYSLEKYRRCPIINVVEYAYFISEEYINDRTDTWYSMLDRIKTDTYKQLLIDLSFSFY